MAHRAGQSALCAAVVGCVFGAVGGYAMGARSFDDRVQAAAEEVALRSATARREPPRAAAQDVPFTAALGLRRDQ